MSAATARHLPVDAPSTGRLPQQPRLSVIDGGRSARRDGRELRRELVRRLVGLVMFSAVVLLLAHLTGQAVDAGLDRSSIEGSTVVSDPAAEAAQATLSQLTGDQRLAPMTGSQPVLAP
jgi:hypothetical protein